MNVNYLMKMLLTKPLAVFFLTILLLLLCQAAGFGVGIQNEKAAGTVTTLPIYAAGTVTTSINDPSKASGPVTTSPIYDEPSQNPSQACPYYNSAYCTGPRYKPGGNPADGSVDQSPVNADGSVDQSPVNELDCTKDIGLPCLEVEALRKIIHELGLVFAPFISRSYCKDKRPYDYVIDIRCNCSYNDVCHVTEIITDTNSRSISGGTISNGTISKAVSNLTFLKTLDMSNCRLNGQIPYSLGNLQALVTLNLQNNFLSGEIPESLGNLSSLKTLNLHYNFLSGSIPSSLGKLSSLETLSLHNNNLSGVIPKELGNLSNLTLLRLGENKLNGFLPEELGSLRKLQHFYLSSNKLTGVLPESYARLTSLTSFEIAGNNLIGPIPKFVAMWTNLTDLYLMGNEFHGELPLEIFNMSNLQYLWVSDVRSPGFLLPEHSKMTKIYYLILRNCSIIGGMPQYIGNWSSLIYLDLSFNNLHGQIPDYMKNLSLNKMFLTRNMLDGVLPSWIHHSIQSKADLSYNNFTKIKFDKRRNQNISISRPQIYNNINIIPQRNDILEIKNISCKGKSKNDYLFINCGGQKARYNGILYDGDTATSNFYISPNEKWAYACSGDFISTTPYSTDFFRNVSGVSTLETSVYDTARLCPLSLTYYGFCLPDGNYTVKLHFAETIYARDADYSSLGQRVFDVYIQGERRLKDFNIKEEAGGPYKSFTKELWAIVKDNLLEIHFYWAGKGSLYNPPALNGPLVSAIDIAPPNFKFPDGKLSTGQIAGIVVGCTLAPLLLLALMWKMGWLGKRESDEICIEVQERSFTLTQIIAATRNFSRQTEIGKGHIGIVYKAGMPFNVTFAVKKISPQTKQQEKDKIQREIFNLLSLRHENLVQLLGSCSRKGHHILIYEYMENGSLHQALFEPDSTIELDWKARYDICLGIAKGLKYLHEDKRFEIVHGNITARNILLDKNHTPKISDFGLARFRDDEDAFTTIKTRGERLYVAPEYFLGKAITVKADVYSYGVVVLEIVSGRTSMEQRPNQEYDVLLDAACVLHARGKILDLVDKKLSSSYDRKQALILLDTAIKCINSQSPTLRPKMSDVVSALLSEKTIEEISSADTQ